MSCFPEGTLGCLTDPLDSPTARLDVTFGNQG